MAKEIGKPGVSGAFACSGLGRVRRGNETWARTVADAYAEAGVRTRLFGGGELRTRNEYEVLRSIPRDWWGWRWWSWHHRYLWEQRTFSWSLRHRLQRGDVDLLHVTDPLLSELMRRWAPSRGLPVVYKDGLLLGAEWCSRFDWVQVLAPYYREQGHAKGKDVSRWFVIPHLVDTDVFRPPEEPARARDLCPGGAVPRGGPMVLAVGDLSPASNKRLHWIVEELSTLGAKAPGLILAGQANPVERAAFERRAREVLGDKVHFRTNIRPEQMPDLYRCADVFAHAATREPFGIVFLEAMATGLPILGHRFAVTEWIIGDAGEAIDMEAKGVLANRVRAWFEDEPLRRRLSEQARTRAQAVYDRRRIVPLYVEMEAVMRAESAKRG